MPEQQQQQQEEELQKQSFDEVEVLRQSLATLDVQKKSIELEADAIISELTTPPSEGVEPMGVDTPLVDHEGYPRGDIDVYRARTLRQRFHVLKTDHKEMTKKIEGMLQHLALLTNPSFKKQRDYEKASRGAVKPKPKFDSITGKWVVMNWDGSVAGVPGGDKRDFHNLSTQVSQSTDDPSLAVSTNLSQSENAAALALASSPEVPFARVNAVSNQSPAAAAGLLEDDLIVQFAHVNAENHNHLREIAALVPDVASRQGSLSVQVKRRKPESVSDDWESVTLSLTPRPWCGRGLIGCHIVPYTN